MGIIDWIIGLLAKGFYFIYQTVAFENYGLTLIIFTILIRLALTPLSIKQAKSTIVTQKMQPRLQQLQKRYGNDKKRLGEEQMKLYTEMNANPMSGCLPVLIQLPILLILLQVIGSPLKYVFGWTAEQIAAKCELLGLSAKTAYVELNIVHSEGLLNMDFFGLDLGRIATWKTGTLFGEEWRIYIPLFILAIVSGLTSFFMSKLTMKLTMPPQEQKSDRRKQQDPAQPNMNMMQYMVPVMSLIFAFQFPAGLIFYWTFSNIVQTVQQVLVTRIVSKKMQEKEALEAVQNAGRKKINVVGDILEAPKDIDKK